MCAIAGIIGKSERRLVERMLSTQRHRAPDEQGVYSDDRITLGMGRLKIIDLHSPGLAPYREDHLVLSYNGEIYNYRELKRELGRKGWQFRTASDTEVLMKAWREWGTKMFDRLNGMFAFALYDAKRKELILARDIAGEKPLYYYRRGPRFVFSSEAKAIPEAVNVQHRENEFFEAFQHCFLTTPWKDVLEVPPASYLRYNIATQELAVRPYWDLTTRSINLKTAEEELEHLIGDAIKLRVRSDVPVGLYASGGLDSSLIADYFNFDHTFNFSSQGAGLRQDFFRNIRRVLWHLDFPVGSFGFFGMWKLAQAAAKKVKVVVSGEGADEIFGGYLRYMPIASEYYLRRHAPSYAYLFNKHFPHPDYLTSFANLTKRNDNLAHVKALLKPFFEKFEDPINAMGYADFKLIFPSLLQMGDRMAGAFGLENRCPFLDKRIIEFGFSLPPEYKIKHLEQKVILRRVAEKRGLTAVLKKEKHGLAIPYNKWNGKEGWDRSEYFNFLKNEWRTA
ncbi:MAG: hypothetical protein HY474_01645 [Candidatus Sungbacteria bacterium]|uniref:asparagine synthase (glutamine-hydrolyzing) n=1 Tax=Candidatus Sungiibacteriota bacterium TaxID=2750080 RepID=A0A933DT53_9BACT|nr:hypothetical protein [Candidatus Sungbacteria bacterium]